MPRPRQQFDWPAIRGLYERGVGATEIARQLPNCPSRQGIEKRAVKEGWEVAQLPDQPPNTVLTGKDATKAVILAQVRKTVPLYLAAQAAGISDDTLRRWRNDDASFAAAIAAARAAGLAECVSRIHEAGERDWKANEAILKKAPETKSEYGDAGEKGGITIVLNIDRSEKGKTYEHGE